MTEWAVGGKTPNPDNHPKFNILGVGMRIKALWAPRQAAAGPGSKSQHGEVSRDQEGLLTERGSQMRDSRKHSRGEAVTVPGKDLVTHFCCPFSAIQSFFRLFHFSKGLCSLSPQPIFLTLQLCLRCSEDSKWTCLPITREF